MTPRMKSGAISALVLLLLALGTFFLNKQESSEETRYPSISTQEERSDDLRDESPGFASYRKLVQHYEKHGHEFGNISQEEYLRQARSLRDAKAGGDILEFVRADGVVTRYERSRKAFIAFNKDKTIRTYFKPNDGEAYFHRQANRR